MVSDCAFNQTQIFNLLNQKKKRRSKGRALSSDEVSDDDGMITDKEEQSKSRRRIKSPATTRDSENDSDIEVLKVSRLFNFSFL
jgi:hypothetical protein